MNELSRFLSRAASKVCYGILYLVISSSFAWAFPLEGGFLFTQQVRLVSGGVADGFANIGVGISGDTAIVRSDAGVHVYLRYGTIWSQQAVLVPSDGLAGCGFPSPVDIEGDTIVAGCPNKSVNGNTNQGAAYVFIRSGTTWTEQQRLLASDGAVQDRFGRSVAISGETIVVGAVTDTVGSNANQGSAYVFVRGGTNWSEQARLFADDGGAGHAFGHMVRIDGNTAVISRTFESTASPANPSVYIFVRTGNTWQQQQRLSVCEASANANCHFGYSTAVKGDRLAVGNEYLSTGPGDAQGGVYFFSRSGTVWTQQQRITSVDGLSNDHFGTALGLEGETLVVGASGDLGVPGKVYVYGLLSAQWTFQQKLQPGNNRNGFGQNVSLDAGTLIAAAPGDAGAPGAIIGAAYIFAQPSGPPTRAAFDFDADGRADIVVRRPADNIWYLLRTSAAYTAMSFGLAGDLPAPADLDGDGATDIAVFRPAEQRWYIFGTRLGFYNVNWGTVGDIPVPADYDGDGRDDVAIYRPSTGTWWIQGSTVGFIITHFGTAEDRPQPGDYDGDGVADFVVRRPSNNIWYLLRSSQAFTAVAWGEPGDLSAPADFDGDGKTDLAVFRPSEGKWYIFGTRRGITQSWGQTGDVPAAADYDGDGQSDIAVYRPSDGNWYILGTRFGIIVTNFGQNGDVPAPSMFNYQAAVPVSGDQAISTDDPQF